MDQIEEAVPIKYLISEDDLAELSSLLRQIMVPSVTYHQDPLEMANKVIEQSHKKAHRALTLLPELE